MRSVRTPARRPRRPGRTPSAPRRAGLGALLLLLLGGAACASSGDPTGDPIYLVVENRRSVTVTIYAVRHSSRFRLGTVQGVQRERFVVRSHMLGPGGELRLAIDPLGDPNRRFTRSIYVNEGDTVVLELIF